MPLPFLKSAFWTFVLSLPLAALAQWTSTNGPHGPVVHAFAAGGGSLYIADDLGIHQSRDRGETWAAIGPAFPGLIMGYDREPWGMVVRHDTLIVAGIKGVRIRPGAGAEWKVSNAGLDINDQWITALVDGPEGLVALTKLGHIYRSADGGRHWEGGLEIPTQYTPVMAMDGRILYAALNQDHALKRSFDNGRTWEPCAPPEPRGDSFAISVACLHPYVLASVEGGVYRSADSGSHWEKINSGIQTDSSTSGTAWKLYVAGSRIYLMYGERLFISADSGKTWSRGIDFPYTGYHHVYMAGIFASGSDLFAITHLGVFRSQDQGYGWKEANTGIACCGVGNIENIGPDRMLATTEDGLYLTLDLGLHWNRYSNSTLNAIPISLLSFGGQLFAPDTPYGLFRSRDEGGTWQKTTDGFTEGNSPILFPMGKDLYYSALPKVFSRSADTGRTWSPVPGWDEVAPRQMVYCEGVSYLTGSSSGIVSSNYDTLRRFDPESETWVAVRADIPSLGATVIGAAGKTLLLATESLGLLGSTDSGNTFTLVTPRSKGWGKINCLLSVDRDIYVGSDSGVAMGRLGSDDWELTGGLPPVQPDGPYPLRVYFLHAQDGFLFAATPTGIWKLPTDTNGIAIRPGDHPKSRKTAPRWTLVSGRVGFKLPDGTDRRDARGRIVGNAPASAKPRP